MFPRCKRFLGVCAAAWFLSAFALNAAERPGMAGIPVGETLKYDIYWGFIPVGHSEITSSWVEEDGRPLINLRFTARSNRFVEKIYPVNDRVDCFIDPQTLLPVRLVKRTSEGRYLCDDTLTFDRDANTAAWEDRERGTNCEYAVAQDTRDCFSLMYVLRERDLRRGEPQSFTIANDNRMHDILIRMGGEEKVDLPDGREVMANRMSVEQAKKGLFVRKVPGAVWVSREDPRVILKMLVRVPVGSVRVVLAGREESPAVSVVERAVAPQKVEIAKGVL